MDMNSYVVEALSRDRLAELRAGAARHRQLLVAAPVRRPLRVVLGLVLIRLGTWTLGSAHRPLAPRAS